LFFLNDDEELTLYPFEYITHEYNVDEKITIQIGGITGSTIVMKGEENQLPQFFTLGGASISPALTPGIGVSFQKGTVNTSIGGISFKNGSINPMDLNLGLFLMEIIGDNH